MNRAVVRMRTSAGFDNLVCCIVFGLTKKPRLGFRGLRCILCLCYRSPLADGHSLYRTTVLLSDSER